MARLVFSACNAVVAVSKALLGALVAAIVLITLAAVWYRYGLNAPLSWTEQVSRILFVWMTFLGAALLYRERLHVGVDLLVANLPDRARIACAWAIELMVLGFNVMLLVFGLGLSLDTLGQTFGALEISPASFYFAAPVAAAMMILFFAERVLVPDQRQAVGAPLIADSAR